MDSISGQIDNVKNDDIIEVSTEEEGKLNVHIGSEINCRDVDQLHISCFDCSKCSRKVSRKVTKLSYMQARTRTRTLNLFLTE